VLLSTLKEVVKPACENKDEFDKLYKEVLDMKDMPVNFLDSLITQLGGASAVAEVLIKTNICINNITFFP